MDAQLLIWQLWFAETIEEEDIMIGIYRLLGSYSGLCIMALDVVLSAYIGVLLRVAADVIIYIGLLLAFLNVRGIWQISRMLLTHLVFQM
jgi:hypothetical protein